MSEPDDLLRAPKPELAALLRKLAEARQDALGRRVAECLPYILGEGGDAIVAGAREGVSYFGLRPGLKSPDGLSVLGLDGHMFLYSGSNQLFEQYAQGDDDPAAVWAADQWLSLFLQRQKNLQARAIRYVQMIIPEKSTLLADLVPIPIQAPTASMRNLDRQLRNHPELAPVYFPCLQVMQWSPFARDTYRKLDIHLTPIGCFELMRQLLYFLRIHFPCEVVFEDQEVIAGGLGDRFPGMRFAETIRMPRSAQLTSFARGLRQIEDQPAANQHNVGHRCVWRNETAPLDLKVACFGNSFFERGGGAAYLSWWCMRLFREFHFLWLPELAYEYVESVRPDVVICQTIERFLPFVPPT